MKNFVLLAGVAVIVAGGAYFYLSQQNGQNPFGGVTSGQSAQTDQNASTTPGNQTASDSISGVYCHTDNADRTLVIHKEEGSPDITFGVSYWFANGHSCGISGEAKLADSQQWLFVHEVMEGKKCGLTIEAQNDGSVKVIESENKCTDLCGANADFGTATFPANSKYKDTTSKEEAMKASELTLCP